MLQKSLANVLRWLLYVRELQPWAVDETTETTEEELSDTEPTDENNPDGEAEEPLK